MSDQVPDIDIVSARRSIWDRVSIVWLVPVAALIIALGVAWQSYSEQGPLIEVAFDNIAGVERNETELRFRNVAVGMVEDVSFTPDLSQVVVGIRVRKDLAPFLDEDAAFWIVRPEVTTQGVSGLDTVLSGVYIEGIWDENPGSPLFRFEGLTDPPLRQGGVEGLELTLRAADGSLMGNTPILYKGVEVGQVGRARVSSDGVAVEARAIVYAPYDNLVTEATRFWDTSGFSVSLGTAGAAIDFESISSLIAGGLTFDTFVSGAPLAQEGADYTIYSDEDSARTSIFEPESEDALLVATLFDGNVSGLNPGARVELNGLGIGQVRAVNGVVEQTADGEERVLLRTILAIQPGRIGLEGGTAEQRTLDFLANQVEAGLRARLVTASILTGGLKVELLTVPDAEPGTLDLSFDPYPLIPSTESQIADVQSSAEDTLARINALPIEELLEGATDFLNSASRLIGSPATQQVPSEVSALLADIRGVVGADEVQDLPVQLGAIMNNLDATVGGVQTILTSIEEERIIANLGAALDSVSRITDHVEASIADVPGLVAELDLLAQKANGLAVEELVAELTEITGSANALISSEAAQTLPERIDLLARDLQTVAADVARLTTSLSDAQAADRLVSAIDAATATLDAVETSFAGVPALVTEIETLAATANEMPLTDLVAEVTGLSQEARGLLGSPEAQALPGQIGSLAGELEATLAEIRGVTASLVANDAAARLLEAIDAVEQTLRTVDASIVGVPDLIAEIDAVASSAAGVPLQDMVADVTAMSQSLLRLVGSDATQALPEQLGDLAVELDLTLKEVRGLVSELNAADAGPRLVEAVNSAARALDTLDSSIAGVPQIVDRVNALAAEAESLELGELVDRVSGLVATAEALLGSEGTQRLPDELATALEEIGSILSELRAGGAVGNVNEALVSARNAADEVSGAVDRLPELLDRASRLLGQADTTLAGFEGTSPAIRDARAALAEISRAAEAVASLARAIERRPNSLLTGR